jgi:4-hydroxybenzoate polyprenyltransferase
MERVEELTSIDREPGLGALRAYLSERFPVPVTLMLSVATGVAAYAVAQAEFIRAGAPVLFDGTAAAGCFAVFLFLFHLRVFDEHKDFDLDNETRPDRPVQRGLITLRQLKVLGAVAIAGQLIIALVPGPSIGALYLLPLGYSVLMYFEFFVKDWLSARIIWYAITHCLVMALIALALGARFTMRADIALSPELWAFLALTVTTFFSVDVLRKMWAPETEVDGVDSYSQRYGLRASAILATGILLASAALGGWIGHRLGGGYIWLGIVALVTVWGAFEVFKFAGEPTVQGEKKMEAVAGVHLLTLYFGIAIVAAVANGAVLGLGDHFATIGVG